MTRKPWSGLLPVLACVPGPVDVGSGVEARLLTVGTVLTMVAVPVLYATLFRVPAPARKG